MNGKDSTDRYLREHGLAFNGKITASLSHELNNAVAIINEYNGLLADMVEAAKQGIPLDDKKLNRSTKKIGMQIERSQDLIKRLNRFAHSSDSFNTEVNIGELLELIVSLSQRLAGLKSMDLEFEVPLENINFRTNPFYLQLAVFTCFEIFMDDPDNNRHIRIETDKKDNDLVINISGATIIQNEFSNQKIELLKATLKQIDGNIELKPDSESECTIAISLSEMETAIL